MKKKDFLPCLLLSILPLLVAFIVIIETINPSKGMSQDDILSSYDIDFSQITEDISWNSSKQEISGDEAKSDVYSLSLAEDIDLPENKESEKLVTYRKGEMEGTFIILTTKNKDTSSVTNQYKDLRVNEKLVEAIGEFISQVNESDVYRYMFDDNQNSIDILGWYDEKSKVYIVHASYLPTVTTPSLTSLNFDGGTHKELSVLEVFNSMKMWRYKSLDLQNYQMIHFSLKSENFKEDEEQLVSDSPTGEGLDGHVCKTQGAGLNLREGPGSKYSIIIVMPDNHNLTYFQEKDGWIKVIDDDGLEGWASKDFVCVGEGEEVAGPKICNTGGVGVIVRISPNTEALEVTNMIEGASVTILETSGSWKKVQNQKGEAGWVPGEYVCE